MANKPIGDLRFWSYVALGFFIFNVVAGWLWVVRTFEEDRVARTRSAVSTVNPAVGEGDLRIDAWTNTSRVEAGRDMLAFSIAIQNPSKTEAQNVRFVSFDLAEGFRVPRNGGDASCWSQDPQPKPVCTTVDNLAVKPVSWPITVAPGGGATVATRLTVIDEPGRWYLTAVVAWTDTGRHLGRRKGMSLGPIIVENASRKNEFLWEKAAQTYLKDLLWPQLAALFGIWVKRLDDRRTQQREDDKKSDEEKFQKERDAHADAERLAQETRAMVQQTWNLMLPTAHRINTTYYMPISHAVAQIYTLHREIDVEPFAADECFYFVWLLHKMMDNYITKEGGWYLKNRRGEEIVAAAWRTVRGWTDAVIAANAKDRAARAIREEAISRFPQEPTFASFTAHLARRAPFPDLRVWFDGAFRDLAASNIMTVFRLMELVIDYEINRPYIYWYGGMEQMVEFDSPEFERIAGDFDRTRKKTPMTAYEAVLNELAREITAYRQTITNESTAPPSA